MKYCFIGNIGITSDNYKENLSFFERWFKMQKSTMLPLDVPDIQHTKPDVFILESLSPEDEKENRYEGEIIRNILRLAGKNPAYYYFRTENELKHLVGLFRESQCRFLHISSHASDTHIGTTFGKLTYFQFSEIFQGHLQLRRLFFSACNTGNENLVKTLLLKNKGMHSFVALTHLINFDQAAAIWSTLYISLFAKDSQSVKHGDIERRLKLLKGLFPVEFFFGSYDSVKDKWNNMII